MPNLLKPLGLDTINYRLFAAIIFTMLLPTLYTTFRIYLISDIPNEWGFNIASQIAWLNIIYEVLQESIILPLFFIFGAVAAKPALFYRKVRNGLLVITPLYSAIAAGIWLSSAALVDLLAQQPELVDDTINYIRWETLAIPFRVITDYALIALIVLAHNRKIIIFLALQLLVRMSSDYIFLSTDALNLGIEGLAYSSCVIAALTAAIGLLLLFMRKNMMPPPNAPEKITEPGAKKWLRISVISGAESGIRNLAFILMILKLVNEVGESGTFWVTNGFIWGWLLLPVLALGSLIKQDVGITGGRIGARFRGYAMLTGIFCALWVLTIPLWEAFIANVMGVANHTAIADLALFMLPFYFAFAIMNGLISYIYGMGRTDLMLYQTIIVNGTYYVGAYALYAMGIFVPSLYSIAVLFGVGICFGFVTTVVIFRIAGFPLARPIVG